MFHDARKYQDSTCETPYLASIAHESVKEKVDEWSTLIRLSVNNCVGYPPYCDIDSSTDDLCQYFVKAKCDGKGFQIHKYTDDTCEQGSRVDVTKEKEDAKSRG